MTGGFDCGVESIELLLAVTLAGVTGSNFISAMCFCNISIISWFCCN